jgi:hypothetical protein
VKRRWWAIAGGVVVVAVVAAGLDEGVDNDETATGELSAGAGPATVDSTPDELPADTEPATTTSTNPATNSPAATDSTVTLPESTPPEVVVAGPEPTAVNTTPTVVDQTLQRLESLAIADPDPARGPYERDSYGGWSDDDGDCRSTRHELLIERSAAPVTFSADGCRVETGRWIDPFTGNVLMTADEATIDHHIPLAEAHRAGAWRWNDDTKQRFANDISPGALNIVAGDVNQSKADQRPDQWLPPLTEFHCAYAIAWVDGKARWDLTITASEFDLLDELLTTCTLDIAPDETPFVEAVVVTTLTPAPTTLPPVAVGSGPGQIRLESCNRRTEEVVITNNGGAPADLSGYLLHDDGRRHETLLAPWGPLPPGSRLTVVTGDDASAGPGRVVWKGQNVWNNDGDVAHLVDPDGTVTTVRC